MLILNHVNFCVLSVYGSDSSHPDLARALVTISEHKLRHGLFRDSVAMAVEAERVFNVVLAKEHPDTVRAVVVMNKQMQSMHKSRLIIFQFRCCQIKCRAQCELDDLRGVEAQLLNSLETLQSYFSIPHPLICDTMCTMGIFHLRNAQYGKAEPVLSTAASMQIALLSSLTSNSEGEETNKSGEGTQLLITPATMDLEEIRLWEADNMKMINVSKAIDLYSQVIDCCF